MYNIKKREIVEICFFSSFYSFELYLVHSSAFYEKPNFRTSPGKFMQR